MSSVEGPAVSEETTAEKPAAESAANTAAETAAETSADPAAAPGAEERELTGANATAGPEPARVIVPRWVQLVLLPLALLGTWELARAAGKVFLIFVVAALIALILNPAVAFLQRSRLPRGVAVFAVYLGFFLTVAGIGVLLANPISNQVQAFAQEVPHIVKDANSKILDFQNYLNRHGLHAKLVPQGKTALQTIQEKLVKGSSSVVSFGGDLLGQAATASFDLILVFVLSVYLLIYGEIIGTLVRRVMPNGDGSRADDYPTLVQRAVSHYVQGQLLFSFIMGTTAGFALYIFGLVGIFPQGSKYAIVFGVFFGLMELIPYLGPILGAAPPILVALFTDPIVAVWVTLLFVVLQQLEGHIVAPQIFGHSLRINPLLVILALLLGQQLYGLIGALVALPILSILRETVVYLSRHLELEPWERSPRGML